MTPTPQPAEGTYVYQMVLEGLTISRGAIVQAWWQVAADYAMRPADMRKLVSRRRKRTGATTEHVVAKLLQDDPFDRWVDIVADPQPSDPVYHEEVRFVYLYAVISRRLTSDPTLRRVARRVFDRKWLKANYPIALRIALPGEVPRRWVGP